MYAPVRNYFRHLGLVCEDIQEELDLIGRPGDILKVCDFGCGQGLSTYGLALALPGSECIGIDRFDGESSPSLSTMLRYSDAVKQLCESDLSLKAGFPGELCRLLRETRLPMFHRGDIVLGHNLPADVDLAYCKRVLINLFYRKHGEHPSGGEGLLTAIKHIARSVRPGGYVCTVEFDGFALDEYLRKANLSIVRHGVFKRNDIRARGRTTVISQYAFYLCQKI